MSLEVFQLPRPRRVRVPSDAADGLRDDASVEARVRGALEGHVRDADFALARRVGEALLEAHVGPPEGGHAPELLLERLALVPAVEEDLLQVDDVAPERERLGEARDARDRAEGERGEAGGEHRADVRLDERVRALGEVEDRLRGDVHDALRGDGAGDAGGASVRLPRSRVARQRPRVRGRRRRHRAEARGGVAREGGGGGATERGFPRGR